MRVSLAVLSLTMVAMAGTAAAQQYQPGTAPPPPPQSRSVGALDRHMQNIIHAQRAEVEAFRDSATGNNLGPQPIERIDLANRVSTLIELGRCGEARELANEAGEKVMALRARNLCRTARS